MTEQKTNKFGIDNHQEWIDADNNKNIPETQAKIARTKQNIQNMQNTLMEMRQTRDRLQSKGKSLTNIDVYISIAENALETLQAELEFEQSLVTTYEKRMAYVKQHLNYIVLNTTIEAIEHSVADAVKNLKRTTIRQFFRNVENAFFFGLGRGE